MFSIDKLDLRLKLDLDKYLLKYETFQFFDKIMTEYNNLSSVEESSIIDLNEQRFYHNYTNIYRYLSVLTLKRDFDDTELQFLAEIAYKQKGSLESLKTILNIVDCEYDLSLKNYTLNITIKYNNVKDIYLSQKYLYVLCNDLLFIFNTNLEVSSMSIKYTLHGETNKRYVVYSAYDLLANPNQVVYDNDSKNTNTNRKLDKVTVHNDNDVKKIIESRSETTFLLDTYEW